MLRPAVKQKTQLKSGRLSEDVEALQKLAKLSF
jgi:hypothetical protein